FVQAEDGIRGRNVTGVQTCALPILRAVIYFLVVFILSASFIAYAPTYVTKINDFSADVSEAALDLGAKMLMPSSSSQGKDSVDRSEERRVGKEGGGQGPQRHGSTSW